MDKLYIFYLSEGDDIDDEYNIVISDDLNSAIEVFAEGSEVSGLKKTGEHNGKTFYQLKLGIEILGTSEVYTTSWYVVEIHNPEKNVLY